MFIRATGNISPQESFGISGVLTNVREHTGNRLRCIEPEYRELIDAKYIRRMSRILKFGVAAALQCLKEAAISNPDAIVTGTAYGCLEDTATFLKKMVDNNEELLTPTSFIQSTHNTVGAQIALILGCNQYNNTFVHRGFSFESALLDAMLLLKEDEARNVLVGTADEITDTSHAILERFGLYKDSQGSNLQLYNRPSPGTIAGEGASFFVLSKEASGNDYCQLDAMATFYAFDKTVDIRKRISDFLTDHSLRPADIDLVINGRNGDIAGDDIYLALDDVLPSVPQVSYKHLCGEYPTATSFAMWMAAGIIKTGMIPDFIGREPEKPVKRVLIYNHYLKLHHSLYLMSSC